MTAWASRTIPIFLVPCPPYVVIGLPNVQLLSSWKAKPGANIHTESMSCFLFENSEASDLVKNILLVISRGSNPRARFF